MDAGGIQALRDRALSSTGDDGGETSREALAELAQTLTWLCRCSYYREDWYPNLEARERVGNARALGNGIIEIGQSGGSDGDRRRVGDESKRLYTPRNPTEEALLASLVFLEEERTIVAPKGRSNIGRSRTNLLPLLMWCGRSKAACEFLSVAENASGHYEGEETFKRWLLLTHACLAARLPGRAVRVSKSLIDSNFEVKDAGSDEDASGAEELGGGTHSAPSASVGPGASESRNGDGSEGTSRDLASSLFAPSSDAHKVHLLLMACRAKLDEHRLAMRSHVFDGGVGAAVATGWAEKALRLSSPDPDLSDLHESAVQAFAGCVLETLTRAHQGNPSCSPPRSTYDSALREAETHLTKIVSAKSNRSLSPITAYLLALVYVRRDKNKEALDLLTKVPNTNSGCQVFMSSLLAVLYGTEKRTSKGFNIVEKMLVNLEMQGMDPGNLEKQFFLHRVQLRFAIHKRGATAIFQKGRHGDNEALIEALTAHGKKRLASLLSADLAVHHACGQKFQKAKKLAQEAIKLDPKCPLAHHSMGVCHEGKPEYGLALAKYEEAMAMCPHYGPSALASALILENRMDDYVWHARDLCEDAVKWSLEDYEALLALGQMKERLGDVEASKALNAMGLSHIGKMPCIPYYEFPVVIWEDDLALDCFSF